MLVVSLVVTYSNPQMHKLAPTATAIDLSHTPIPPQATCTQSPPPPSSQHSPGPDVAAIHAQHALPQRSGRVEVQQPAQEELDAHLRQAAGQGRLRNGRLIDRLLDQLLMR